MCVRVCECVCVCARAWCAVFLVVCERRLPQSLLESESPLQTIAEAGAPQARAASQRALWSLPVCCVACAALCVVCAGCCVGSASLRAALCVLCAVLRRGPSRCAARCVVWHGGAGHGTALRWIDASRNQNPTVMWGTTTTATTTSAASSTTTTTNQPTNQTNN